MATMVANDNLLKDAALIVDVCFSVEEGDVVTIVCDDERGDEARAVAEVCVERGAWPVIVNNEQQVRRGRRRPLHLPLRRDRPVRASPALRRGSAPRVHRRESEVKDGHHGR